MTQIDDTNSMFLRCLEIDKWKEREMRVKHQGGVLADNQVKIKRKTYD